MLETILFLSLLTKIYLLYLKKKMNLKKKFDAAIEKEPT